MLRLLVYALYWKDRCLYRTILHSMYLRLKYLYLQEAVPLLLWHTSQLCTYTNRHLTMLLLYHCKRFGWPEPMADQAVQTGKRIGVIATLRTTLDGLTDAYPLVISNEAHRFIAAEQLRQMGRLKGNILLEPVGRNTAPAIALAALTAAGVELEPRKWSPLIRSVGQAGLPVGAISASRLPMISQNISWRLSRAATTNPPYNSSGTIDITPPDAEICCAAIAWC